ncbi:MAG: hypothetical protein ACR2Q4_24345 [Geminicoccaceae bacterium]
MFSVARSLLVRQCRLDNALFYQDNIMRLSGNAEMMNEAVVSGIGYA